MAHEKDCFQEMRVTPITRSIKRISARNLAAVEWLIEYLKDGPRHAGEGRVAALVAGIGRGSLLRARQILGIKRQKENGRLVGWRTARWELPPGPPFKLPDGVKITWYRGEGKKGRSQYAARRMRKPKEKTPVG